MHENREISQSALVWRSRPVREGHEPHGGHARAGEVGLCRNTREAAEQGRATFCGGCGGKGTDEGEHRSVTHAPDTEREARVRGLDGVRRTAREKKQERFTALLYHLSIELLRDSFYAFQRRASPGVDGVTWQVRSRVRGSAHRSSQPGAS
jgi:hypothetical protein